MRKNRSTRRNATAGSRFTFRRIAAAAKELILIAALFVAAVPFVAGCDEFERVAAQHQARGDDGDLTPWEMFCLLTSEPGEDIANCLDGQPD